MFKKLKSTIAAAVMGLALSIFSTNSLSAAAGGGKVTFLYYISSYYTLLVTAGNTSCGVTIYHGVEPGKIAGAIAMIAAAKANGTDIFMACGNTGFDVQMR